MKPREDRHKCCVCGTKSSKTAWIALKGKCEACGKHCADWYAAVKPEGCAFHRA